jgi:hypothetical protein
MESAGESASQSPEQMMGIETKRFTFTVQGERTIVGYLIIMEKSCYLWLSTPEAEPSLNTLATAIPTRFDSMPISSVLFGDDDHSAGLSQQLSKRFNIQTFVSVNLPDSYDDASSQISSQLVAILKDFF